ncbi:MAG TPA: RimK family protein [Alphaproteobacteria bacterium]|nr:RimK family protein [Alphaproteobacteria bacterium]
MTAHIVVVDRRADFKWDDAGHPVVTAREYLSRPDAFMSRYPRIINLCRDYEYMSFGYYCSLLAEARGERVIPAVSTILDLSKKSIYGLALDELDELLEKMAKKPGAAPSGPFSLFVFFGFTEDDRYQELAHQIFDLFRCPLLKVGIEVAPKWRVASIRPVPINELKAEQEPLFQKSLDAYTRTAWRRPKSKSPARYYMAILQNPQEQLPPSSTRTLQKFVKIGEPMGLEVELIEKKDYHRLAEYDALFIRETTSLDHHTYRFAKKAEYEDMVVIDDPTSILRCTNKVYLAELMRSNRVPTPRTLVVDRVRMAEIEVEFGYPLVLKIPDGSFSRGVVKVENKQELKDVSTELFRKSELIIAQEFIPTKFDWRIGVLNGRPIYACQYFMSRNHWQIVKYTASGRFSEGGCKTLAIEEAPPAVVETAIKATRLIGDGLYGVDLKETERGPVVIEINDNPSIDMGVEDSVLKDELYRIILGEFLRRLDAQMEPSRPGNGAANGAGNGDAHVPGLGEPRLPFEITRKVSDSSGR